MALQPRLIPPPEWAMAKARDATRRARERAGDGPAPKWERPWWDPPPVSHPPATVEGMARGRIAADPSPHGTRARYNYRPAPCRCVKCRTANARYQAAYRASLKGPEGQGDTLAR